jgi:hypothetical protein
VLYSCQGHRLCAAAASRCHRPWEFLIAGVGAPTSRVVRQIEGTID